MTHDQAPVANEEGAKPPVPHPEEDDSVAGEEDPGSSEDLQPTHPAGAPVPDAPKPG